MAATFRSGSQVSYSQRQCAFQGVLLLLNFKGYYENYLRSLKKTKQSLAPFGKQMKMNHFRAFLKNCVKP